jgi:ABC-type Mn2+/Zn2+ transport system ATPase subunit
LITEEQETPPLLEAQDLAVKYPNGDLALHDMSFSIDAPSFTAIIGPNGSGKSTFIRTILGLMRPVHGHVRVLGYDSVKDSKTIQKLIRYVPQRDHIELTVPMKVKDIVLMGRLMKKSPPRFASGKDREAGKSALKRVNMLDLWDRPFPELSGGQRQRVLVARALAGVGQILVLDEPLAGTDAESQKMIVEALGEYQSDFDVSIIMVTHDLNPIHILVKHVLLLRNTLVGIGTPCDVMDPELIKSVYGPAAEVVEYAGHRYCITPDSGVDRHD